MSNKIKKLILIDGNAIIHRAYHALPPLTTKKGELVNAVYGFASTLLSVIDKFRPDYILASFDLAAPTFRHKEYKEYKATRVKADQELYDQIPRVKEVTRAMGIPILEKEGFEADDVIGSLIKISEENKKEEIENIIITGDLDTLQLVSEKTKAYAMRRGLTDSVLYDEEKIRERYGLEPEQLIDFKGLRGDPSDNIPGVKGIGEKTAAELLQKFETLEGVYKNIRKIKGAVKEKLEKDKAQAVLSKKLATIEKNIPLEIDFKAAKTKDFDREKLVALFQELNFYSLIKRIPGSDTNLRMHANDTNNTNKKEKIEAGIKDFKYEIIKEEKTKEFFEMLDKQNGIAIKINDGGIAFSWKNGRAAYIENVKTQNSNVKTLLENSKINKIGYDLKTDIKILKKNGIDLKGSLDDIMLEAYVLDPGAKNELEMLVLKELGEEMKIESKKGQLGLGLESPEEKARKLCQEADYIFKLHSIFQKKIGEVAIGQGKKNNLKKVYEKIEVPLIPVLAEMEVFGIKLNKIVFEGISRKIEARIKNLEKGIYALSGEKFNINSPKQLAEILFEKMKIPTADIKKGKTGFSTASSELNKIKGKYKIAEKIEEYREIFKLKTTYLDVLPGLSDEKGRIHTSFNQAVTATGRLSSSDPNLQNIPIRTEIGQLLRVAFEAEIGWKLVSADYSQIDLRSMAHMSQDKKLIDLFWKGEDIHRATAAEINKVSVSKVTEKMRSAAKELNFGVIYGMSIFGFSQAAGVNRDEAKKFIDAYFEKFPKVAQFLKKTKELAKKNGFVESETGRRRYVPEINSPNFQVEMAGERMAINMSIQGLSADIVKIAMIKIHEEYKNNPDVRMILQVHDEIILEVKEEMAQEVGNKLKEIMENAYKLCVPLKVDIKIGDNWGEI